ncbi:MAG: T9SS type A sorting domain-containing protein [Bacteroidetes bacterium]|nr:MAG: T9SS type A sorting domain-containing protein [Bacteroidota bacterium]
MIHRRRETYILLYHLRLVSQFLNYQYLLMKKVLFMTLLSGGVFAQTYNPPVSVEYAYPTSVSPGASTHSSCYVFDDIALAAYDDGNDGQVIWQYFNPGGPSMNCGGTINYNGGYSYLEVGALAGSASGGGATYTVFVAYHQNGVGHAVDLYDFDPYGCNITYVTTHNLSNYPDPTRISMDNHIEYALAMAWTDDLYIYTATYNSGTFTPSPVHQITPVVDRPINVDVAFTHAPANMNPNNWDLVMHYVYTQPTFGQNVVTCALDFWTVMGYATPQVLAATTEDVNFVTGNVIFPNIDGADHDQNNWAYAYTANGLDIEVRLNDFAGGVPPTTVVVNNGSMGNTANNSTKNLLPTLAYNAPPAQEINVGWYTRDQNESYIGVIIQSNGSGMVSANDYLTIPNNPGASSSTPALAYSKMTEFSIPHQYVFFAEQNGATYDFVHKFHDQTNFANFKSEEPHTTTCSHYANTAVEREMASIEVFPNPVRNSISLQSDELSVDTELNARLVDITGKVILEGKGSLSEINDLMNSQIESLQTGSYTLNLEIEGGSVSRSIKIQKL